MIATEGALAVLTVYVSGNPVPDVYWRKGKKDITNIGKFRIIEGGHLQVCNINSQFSLNTSVTTLGDLLNFGQLLKPLATIHLSKSPTFSGNFSKDVEIYHFSREIFFGQLLKTFGVFFLVTLLNTQTSYV